MMSREMELIRKEREKTSFQVDELTNIIDGDRDKTEIRRKVENIFKNDPNLKQPEICNMTREERFVDATRRTVYLYKTLFPREGWSPLSSEISFFPRAIGIDYAFVIHAGAFTPSLMSFGSEEQVAKWLPLAANLNIVGTYAQTELGHGTFLRGLETVAIYDRATEEFVINCPQISAMKWWPGDMGKSANHVLLMANLVIDDKKYGMHPFIVQIRDLTTHMPLPGITVGDIGDKLAFDAVDNGFLYLQNVRIPRENLLCKHAEVLADGSYKKKASDRLMYGSMVNLRVNLLHYEAIFPLAKACTIAIRYSTVRQQGHLDPKKPEVPVMDYVAQQHKLLPQLATAYAALFAVNQLRKTHKEVVKKIDTGDVSELPEIHALSAGMKASVTEQCVASAEIARRACGGHGYSNASGLPMLVTRMAASCTYEGENTVMYLQCARYLMKCINEARSTRLGGSVAYLNNQNNSGSFQTFSSSDFKTLDFIVKCFQQRSLHVVKEASTKLNQQLNRGLQMHDAWNESSLYLIKAAKAHIIQYIVSRSAERVIMTSCSSPLKKVLLQLISLYALNHINNNTGDFIKFGVLTTSQCDAAQEAELELLSELRPNSVGLVDAFDFSDEVLQSCIGSYDGNAYERLFETAKRAPLNRTQVHEASYKYLRPYLHEGRDILEGKVKSNL